MSLPFHNLLRPFTSTMKHFQDLLSTFKDMRDPILFCKESNKGLEMFVPSV